MATIRPFRGWRYGESVKSLSEVVVPPYDVISPAELARLKKTSAYNFSHIILPEGKDDKHKKAAELFNQWRQQKVFIQDKNAAFYFYLQTFDLKPQELFCQPQIKTPSGLRRSGILCRVGLEDYSSKIILPHEKTFSGPKADRYLLMTAAQGNMEPVFLGYDSPRFGGAEFDDITSKNEPVAHFKDSAGVEHSLWAISDSQIHRSLEEALHDKKFYILDGHHRYETALQFFKDHRKKDARASLGFALANICSFRQPGTIVLPTHRLVKGLNGITADQMTGVLEKTWEVSRRLSLAQVEQVLLTHRGAAFGIRFAGEKGYGVMTLKEPVQRLDLEVLHWDVLPALAQLRGRAFEESEISYIKDITDLDVEIDEGRSQVGFLVRPSTCEEVMVTAEASKVMPHKSTFFFPKIPSGLVVNLFDD